MIKRLGFLAARLTAAAIFVLTWGYGVTTHSAFAFDMFVKPQLFPFLTNFVNWHHAWFGLAFALSAITLVPIVRGAAGATPRFRAAQVLAIAYVAIIGAVVVWLSGRPYLASLARGSADWLVVPGALLPLMWLAAIDHLAAPRLEPGTRSAPCERALLVAAIATAVALWVGHASVALFHGSTGTVSAFALGAGWAMLLDVSALVIIYIALALASTIGIARGAAWERGVIFVFIAFGIAEFVRHVMLPPLAFAPADATAIAIPFGVAIAAAWTSLRHESRRAPRRPLSAIALTVVTMLAGAIAIDQVASFDWAFIVQQAIAIVEALIVFGLILSIARHSMQSRDWSMALLIAPAALVVLALHALPPLTSRLGGRDPQDAIDRAAAGDPFARVAASALIARQPLDTAFYSHLTGIETAQWSTAPVVHDTPAPAFAPPASLPHVFIFVIDSLRRDYLSTYNPAVTFTPKIDQWARESHVFRNAFTPYGGTWLAMPSLWAGKPVPRGWATIFEHINMIEQLVTRTGFDFLINDYTVESELRPETKRTFLNRFVPSVQTDLCQNLTAIETHMKERTATQPVFAFLAPMNIHILNTRVAGGEPDYPGFYAPYADRLKRIDGCFGDFIAFLKTQGLYDQSLVMVTGDHGDSLGEGGRWGHQAYLFPEVVRVPLIVKLPADQQSRFTTDLGRLTMLSDVAPTLFRLLGQPLPELDPPNGSSFYVLPNEALRDHRRAGFMVMASYGPTYGLLRRNGRELYVADMASFREYAFRLGPVGYDETPLGDARRRVNQTGLVGQLDATRRLYARNP